MTNTSPGTGEKEAAPANPTANADSAPTLVVAQPTPTQSLPTEKPGNRIIEGSLVQSDKSRLVVPNSVNEDMKVVSDGNNNFAFDLYPLLQPKDSNFLYSPYSISSILAMALAGARGETALQMADILRLPLPPEQLHPAFNAIEAEILSHSKDRGGPNEEGFILNVANSIWGQQDRPYQVEYLDTLSENYGAGLHTADFTNAPEEARQAINTWVSQQTHEKILDLFPSGSITPMTRLVLANAIYFKGGWLYPFDVALTKSDYFFFLVGGQTTVTMMHNTATYGYKKTDKYEVIDLPYQGGGESMRIIMPIVDEFANIEKSLNATTLKDITSGLEEKKIDLSLPQFNLESRFALREVLIEMGMLNAFAPLSANFSGIDGTRDLYIDKLEHKTIIKVDENGTEAAAASGAALGLTAMDENPPMLVSINHPFIFVIQDQETGLLLFIGRVLNPTKTGAP